MFVLVAQAASKPTAPVISASALSSTSIQIGLITPSTEPTYGIGSYALYYSTASVVGPWTQIASGVAAGGFPYTWNGAAAGTTYFMMVTGEDNSPNHKASPPSNTPSVTTTSSSTGWNPQFPRLGAVRFGSSFASAPYQNWIKYCCLETLMDPQEVAGSGTSTTAYGTGGVNAYVNNRHASTQVPGGCKIINYVNPMSYQGTGVAPYAVGSPPLSTAGYVVIGYLGNRFSHIDGSNWLLRAAAPSGNPVQEGNTLDPNISTYTATDSAGDHYGGFFAKWTLQNCKTGSGAYYGISGYTPGIDNAINLDGMYSDETWYTVVFAGDVALQGSTPSGIQHVATNTSAANDVIANNWRAGHAQVFARWKADFPAGLTMANANFGSQMLQFNPAGLATPSIVGAMYQVLDMTEQQFMFGWGFLEGNQNFATMMELYRFTEGYLNPAGPQIAWLDIAFLEGIGANAFGGPGSTSTNGIPGSAPLTWSDDQPTAYTAAYQGMRYITAFTLMRNGGILCDGFSAGPFGGLFQYDEWGNNGAVPCGYLGLPTNDATGAKQSAADPFIGSGIWRRTFQLGSTIYHILMNPRGNGAKANVVLKNRTGTPITMHRLNGLSSTQSATGNDGSAHTTFSFADPDGVIFHE